MICRKAIWIGRYKENVMEREKKTVSEQLGQIALGFAEIVSQMEKEKVISAREKSTIKKWI